MSYLKSTNNFIRINFIGKPFELNKLVHDNNVILYDENEMNLAIKACRLYKGWIYLSQILSFSFLYIAYSTSRKFNFNRKKQIGIIGVSFIPGIYSFIFSHFSYWHIIRDLVIKTREREKKYSHLNKDTIEEFQMVFNRSKDLHNTITSNVGFVNSLAELFKSIN
jgi:hypothetical protein